MANEENGQPTPAYFPWKTFDGFVAELSAAGVVPPQIDGSVMRSKSGSVQSMIRTGLRFLNLTTDNDATTTKFRQLVEAYGTDEWKSALSDTIMDAYGGILKGVDLKAGTAQQLHEQFRAAGATGSVLIKAVRFFLAALENAGIEHSPHFHPPKAKGVSGPRKLKKTGTGGERKPPKPGDSGEGQPKPPAGTVGIPLAIPGRQQATLYIPEGLSLDEWEMIDAYVRAYIRLSN